MLNDLFLFGLYSGIQNNVNVSQLTGNGFSYVYHKPYSHATNGSEMDVIKNSCLPTSILCLGGLDSTNVLLVIACGLCSVVLSETVQNTPPLHNGAYWYYSPNVEYSLSMGFAPSSKMKQKNADCFDLLNKQRISWQLHVNIGGYRLGPFIDLITKFYNNFKFCLLVIVSNIKHNP
jgi:hypothetical protein